MAAEAADAADAAERIHIATVFTRTSYVLNTYIVRKIRAMVMRW